jgi:hypothetical protein
LVAAALFPLLQAKAMQIFHAACRQGHFRLTVHTLDASSAAAAAALAAAAAAGSCLDGGSVGEGGGGSDGRSRSTSPTMGLSILLGGGGSARVGATPELLSPVCGTPPLPGTPLSALALGSCISPSPTGSPLSREGSLTLAAAAALGAASGGGDGTGAGTVIEFGMHAFTVGSAVLSLLRWVAELRERLPREPNSELKQQVSWLGNFAELTD